VFVFCAAAFAVACAAEPVRWAAASPASPAPASVAPATTSATFSATAADPDAATLGDDCLACHTGDMVRQQRLTDKQWAKTVDKMRTWGAPTEDENVAPLVARLVATHPADAGPYVPLTIPAEVAAALFVGQPDGAFSGGDAGRGHALYSDRCAPCHADDAGGGEMGVALAGRHILDRASDLAAVVRAGRGRMPGDESTTDAELADLLAYLRSLPGR
jgi:mono/diheme cytochrome c family protein